MRIKARLVQKYAERSGVSQNTGNAWRSQDMKFQILREDWSDSNEHIIVGCTNPIYIDAPALTEGAVGVLSMWSEPRTWNGKEYNEFRMNGWAPQSEATKVVAEQMQQEQAQQFTPEQLAAAAAMLQQQNGQKKDGLPF